MDQLDPNHYCVARLFREKCVLWSAVLPIVDLPDCQCSLGTANMLKISREWAATCEKLSSWMSVRSNSVSLVHFYVCLQNSPNSYAFQVRSRMIINFSTINNISIGYIPNICQLLSSASKCHPYRILV